MEISSLYILERIHYCDVSLWILNDEVDGQK